MHCQREFRTTLTHCPFDRGALVAGDQAVEQTVESDSLDTSRTVMRCGRCQTDYDLGANYCIFDGELLTQVDETETNISFDAEMVCPECETHYDGDAFFCPNDGTRLVPSQTDRVKGSSGAIPSATSPAVPADNAQR